MWCACLSTLTMCFSHIAGGGGDLGWKWPWTDFSGRIILQIGRKAQVAAQTSALLRQV